MTVRPAALAVTVLLAASGAEAALPWSAQPALPVTRSEA